MLLRPRAVLFFVAFASLLPLMTVLGQTSATAPNSGPSSSHVIPTDQEQIISFWTTETGWRTELQLRNNQVAQDLAVTPVLRTPDGTETPLSPVTIKPQEVKSLDLDTAIGTSAPQVIGTYGSVVLRYHSTSIANLYAVSMIHGIGHSIAFHIDGVSESQDFQAGSREGIWWLPNNSASDYLILVNQGGNPLQLDLSLFDASGKPSVEKLILPPRATNRLSVRQLVTAAGLAGSYGGIKVSVATHAGSLDTLHVLFDEKAGFSAIMKMFDYDPKAQITERDYAKTGLWTLRAPMLALSNPDPSLAFPVGTTLHPQLFVRNTAPRPIDASLLFNWRSDSVTGKAPGPALHLNPYETRRVDVAVLQDGKTLPQDARWTSVTLTTNSQPDEVIAVAASYDQTLQYGAQTPFSDQLSFKWEGGMWEFDPYHNSIMTAGNGGTKPTRAAFTIFYNQGAQKYELEQSLQPDEQMWIDVGKLIRGHVPDKNGNTLPADLTSGSYQFSDLTDKGVGALFEGKVIYDKTYGHVTYGCAACCGWGINSAQMWYDPLGIPMSFTAGQGVDAYSNCDAQYEDVSSFFYNNWSTGSTSIATVDYYGTHTGVSVGSTTSSTTARMPKYFRFTCPIDGFTASGTVNVTPTVTIDSFSPNPIPTGGTANVHITVNPSANVNLAISSSGTGTATFGTSGNTTLTIPGTTTVNVTAGSQSSNGAADLTLSAKYGSTLLDSKNFSVTTGACTATYTGNGGGGALPCPVQKVQVYDTYAIQQFCSACTFTCIPVNFDSTFTPDSNAPCVAGTAGVVGAGNRSLTSTAAGSFAPTDCNVHNLQIKTTIVNAQGTTSTNYTGGTFGLKCNSNGSPSCQ